MKKKGAKSGENKSVHRGSRPNLKGTIKIPRHFDDDAIREWNRIIGERRSQQREVLSSELPLLKAVVLAYSYAVKIRMLLRSLGLKPGGDLKYFDKDWKKFYLGACEFLNCTPALPDMKG